MSHDFQPRWPLAAAVTCLMLANVATAQSALERLGDASSIAVTQIVSVPLGPTRFATAVRATNGTLRVIAWGLASDGQVTQLASGTAGATDRIAAAAMGRTQLVTAVRTETGNLRLIAWGIGATGTVSRQGDADAGPVEEVAVVAATRTMAVTAVRDADSDLKLISWRIDSTSGSITRLRDTSFGKATQPAVVAIAPRRLVAAIRAPSGRVLLRAIDVDADGGFQTRSSILGATVSEFSLAPLAVERVVTAGRRSADGTLQLQAWNVTPAGVLSLRSEIDAGAASDIALTTRGTAHALTAVRLATGAMRLIAWDAVGSLVRLGSIDAGDAAALTAITLGTDRVVTAVRTTNGTLKVIAWRDRAVTMLRGEWGPATGPRVSAARPLAELAEAHPVDDAFARAVPTFRPAGPRPGGLRPGDFGWTTTTDRTEPAAAIALSPALVGPAVRTGVNSAGYDPMIAVGHQFIVVSQDHEIAFFGRDGVLLTPKRGEAVQLSADDFFAAFTRRNNADGTPNEQNINRHIGTGAWFDECNLTAIAQQCIQEFYDSKVVYDRTSRRFVIVSAARGDGMSFAKDDSTRATDPAVRRYFAVAISKSEDPRDGFWQYMTTESNYADWPRVIAQHGVVVMSHNSYQASDEWREGPTPTTYVFVTDSMRTGRPRPPSRKLYAAETGGSIVPVANYGAVTGNWTSLTRRDGDVLHLYSFRTFASLQQAGGLAHASVTLDAGLPDKRNVFDVRRGNQLYLAGHLRVDTAVRNVKPARYSVRVVRLPLTLGSAGLPTPTAQGTGFLDTYFGKRATSDAATDLVSYEVPSMAVTADGDMVFVYGRIPVQTASPLFPEARYSVMYADSRGLRRSRLLQAGEWMPTATFDDASTTATVHPFVNGRRKLDHTAATVDPVDDRTVWMAAAFADSSRQSVWDSTCGRPGKDKCRRWSSMVIGRVKP